MPTSSTMLGNLTAIANDALIVAALWHAVVIAWLLALASGFCPSIRASAKMLIGLAASVSVVSFAYDNPFNGTSFALLTGILSRATHGFKRNRFTRGTSLASVLGAILIAYGLVYPHFLEDAPLVLYLVAAPVGLLPCPTLSVMIGVTLVAKNAFSRSWAATLAVFGLFYALFGITRLHVFLDAGLLVGALALALAVVTTSTQARPVAAS